MATLTMPPIDLYAETQEERDRFDHARETSAGDSGRTSGDNGDLDTPALDAGELRLDQVLGW